MTAAARALRAWLDRAARGGDRLACVVAAAEVTAADPWAVVQHAGLLARCTLQPAPRPLGLTAGLRAVAPTAPSAVVRVEAGQPYPAIDRVGRRARGAFDTPPALARRLVRAALGTAEGRVRSGLDPACGTGAFLLAMAEAGVDAVEGGDLDPVALAVASVAVPRARLSLRDALEPGPPVDLVCGNPPYVPPERQDRAYRAALRSRFPWLHGRFDLVVPFAAVAADRVRPGGALGLILPTSALVQPYGAALRRRWVERHRVALLSGPEPFPGASVRVALLVLQIDRGPAPLPRGVPADELLRLDTVPLEPDLRPGDVPLVEAVRARSLRLGQLAHVDTGLVAHGPGGGKARLLREAPGPGRVPFADARDFFAGRHGWLSWEPDAMHRAKDPEVFEAPKIVIQRLRGGGPVRAAIDCEGIYVGHTCTVVVPRDERLDLERALELIRSPLVDAVVRIERGQRLDLYPHDVASIPVPLAWLDGSETRLEEAWGLSEEQVARLRALALTERPRSG